MTFKMLLIDFKCLFFNKLKPLYAETEIKSFYAILLRHYLFLEPFATALQPGFTLSKNESTLFIDALNQLQQFKPIQYITGKAWFYGLDFEVDENVLIPRPETEELVSWVLEDCQNKQDKMRIIDLGCGSGCIGISLAKKLPNARISCLDLSKKALKITLRNARTHEVKIKSVKKDLLKINQLKGKYHLIISNPPYVLLSEKANILPNVLNYEPHQALFVPHNDPAIYYKKIITLAQTALKKGGFLYFEINPYLAKKIVKFLKNTSFNKHEIRNDINNKERMLKIWKN